MAYVLPDVLKKERRSSEIVHRDGEEALKLFAVQIQRHNSGGACEQLDEA